MKLAGLAACVPKNKVSTTEAHKNFKPFDVDRIIGNTGVTEKREAEPGTTALDLCIKAADPLIEELGWERDSIDAVIFVSTSPDHIMPSSSYRAQHELGLGTRCLVFDVNLACSGFTHGMLVLNGLMASGVVKRALLLCGDMSSGLYRPRITEVEHRTDLANAILFGDAGTATALDHEGDQLSAYEYGADGSGYDQIIVPGGQARAYWSPALFERVADEEGDERRPIDLVLRGPQILTFTMKRVPPLLNQLLEQANWTRDDVDVFALHQANKFMLNFLSRRAKMPADKVPLSLEEFGNTTSASIPLTMLTRCAERLTQPTKWLMMGFGVGLSWSGLAMDTDSITSVPLVEI